MKKIIPGNFTELIQVAAGFNQPNFVCSLEILMQAGYPSLSSPAQPPVFYIIDYTKNSYLFIDPLFEKLLGYGSEYILAAGPAFYSSLIHPGDYKIFSELIVPQNLTFLKQKRQTEVPDYSITVNYRIKNNMGLYRKILQRSCYIHTSPDGFPLATAGFAIDITHFKEGNSMIHTIEKINRSSALSPWLQYKKIHHPQDTGALLTKREIEILDYLYEGYSSKQIAEKIFLSIYTIHNHRKNMLKKTNSNSTAELIRYANHHGYL